MQLRLEQRQQWWQLRLCHCERQHFVSRHAVNVNQLQDTYWHKLTVSGWVNKQSFIFPLKMQLQRQKVWAKLGKRSSNFYPKQIRSYFSSPESLCKISPKTNQNRSHRRTYEQKNTSDFIVCSTLCYSNETDKKLKDWSSSTKKNSHLR